MNIQQESRMSACGFLVELIGSMQSHIIEKNLDSHKFSTSHRISGACLIKESLKQGLRREERLPLFGLEF